MTDHNAFLGPDGLMRLNVIFRTRDGYDVHTALCYDPADPCAIEASLFTANRRIDWLWSRDLLAAGMFAPSGLGDVRVYPLGEYLVVTLDAPSGRCELAIEQHIVCNFLDATFRLVPLEKEYADDDPTIEAELEELLYGEAAA